MELSRGTATKRANAWRTDLPLAYQIEGNHFEFYPYAWLSGIKDPATGESDRDTFGIKGEKPARALLKVVVDNKLGLGLFSYTIQGETGERRELSAAETKEMYESDKFDVSIVAKFANGKPKGHFLFTPKKPAKKAAAKKPANKKPAARTLKGL